MLTTGSSDYSLTLATNHQDNTIHCTNNRLVQKWIDLVDRCLEQQWKDSQQLLVSAKILKDASNLFNLDQVVKELSDLGLGIMQRSIDLRQELVDNAFDFYDQPINNPTHPSPVSTTAIGRDIPVKHLNHTSLYVSLPSSPESDVYEPLLRKSSNTASSKRLSYSSEGYSPFTLHSKLWEHQRRNKYEKKTTNSFISSSSSSSSSSSLSSSMSFSASRFSPSLTTKKLSEKKKIEKTTTTTTKCLLAPSPSAPTLYQIIPKDDDDDDDVDDDDGDDGDDDDGDDDGDDDDDDDDDDLLDKHPSIYSQDQCSSNFIPACTYNYYPTSGEKKESSIQCQQCFFCRSSMPRQRSFSLDQTVHSLPSNNSSTTSSAIITTDQYPLDKENKDHPQVKDAMLMTEKADDDTDVNDDDINDDDDDDDDNDDIDDDITLLETTLSRDSLDLDELPMPPTRRDLKSPPPSYNNSNKTMMMKAPSIPIPLRTSSSLDTAVATPFIIATTPKPSTPVVGARQSLSSHITPSTASSSSSIVHTMSTKFHFKRSGKKKLSPTMAQSSSSFSSATTAFSHHSSSPFANDDNNRDDNDNDDDDDTSNKTNRFIRSLWIGRKVSFPTLFASKKVHPLTPSSIDDDPFLR
ncbi:uncharacterized protein BX664DRAFT_200150 [Halteromyces radiatus]|uniref:uncharacterized protein n=1 Tax=Halteromyces radiatus TaxID=101107 RepID=UPI00221EAC7D|nr:uncharacterized protein BX664DRAFT_200150 [Halteromyces radiatus]KAI8081746.1 hypothetical protein BX664DRAFT_200150 [Halteromyces radiatus]